MPEFEWDENKNRKNTEKRKVDFEEAKTIFDIEFEASRNGEYRIVRIGKCILKKSLKNRTMEVLTVKEAVERVNKGGNLKDVRLIVKRCVVASLRENTLAWAIPNTPQPSTTPTSTAPSEYHRVHPSRPPDNIDRRGK